ncbi:hypothetical protein JANAI62_24620 [Jannaschia pagri]|uniref:O-Antigen ligase n=1 Tax=Jannaschia pagri TaxID=2829797 RepID=A0ABQ4NN81_9RHOB|nr:MULTISPECIES: hypothetical protein [unclassified Jannaschia]GIT92005.1 hypothetical protein JANAI61_24630 [Jannaschia sp. AI_61]GIT95839.1 hypothetical protein JANAI62_24620 [Jannaschia sp. AI_62]
MQFFPTSAIVLIAIGILMVHGPRRAFWAFLALTPLAATAAFNLPAVGGASILLADLAAIAIFFLIALRDKGFAAVLGTVRIGQPGFWLLLLTLYAIVATMLFPRLFAGETFVFGIARDGNEEGIVSIPLRPSNGNLTQLFRHLLGVCVFLAAATLFRLAPDPRPALVAVAAATGLNAVLGWADVLTYAVGLSNLLEPIRTANYAILYDVRMVGIKRMIGGFPEASSFGYYSLGLFGFWLHYWIFGPRDRLGTIMLALTLICVVRSTSSAAYVGLVAFLGLYGTVALVANLGGQVSRRGARIAGLSVVAVWLLGVAIFAAYELVQPVTAFLDRALFTKLDNESGVERFSWNAQAMVNFYDTLTLGAGLGSVRASSWPFAVLASLGSVGGLLYAGFLTSVIAGGGAWGGRLGDSVVANSARVGCVAFLVSATLTAATPDLGLTFYAFAGVAVGLTRGAVLLHRRGQSRQIAVTAA